MGHVGSRCCAAGVALLLAGCQWVYRVDLDAGSPPQADALPDAPSGVIPHIEDGDLDGDNVPNAIDLCPYDPNVGSDPADDTDHDGVGDACDPHPGTPGDCIVLVDGFAATLDTRWTLEGSWPFQPTSCAGQDGQGLCVQSVAPQYMIYSTPLYADRIELRAVVIGAGTTATASLFVGTDAVTTAGFDDLEGHMCGAIKHVTDMFPLLAVVEIGSDATTVEDQQQSDPGILNNYTAIALTSDPAKTCDINELSQATGSPPATPPGGTVGFRIENINLFLNSIVVYGTNCAPR